MRQPDPIDIDGFDVAVEFPADYGGDREWIDRDVGEAEAVPAAIQATPFVWRDPKTIPPRRWLYGKHLARGYLSTTAAPAGIGKSSLELVETLAIASGRDLLGSLVHQQGLRVWYWGGEDPLDETERRIAAICLQYDIGPREIEGRLFINSGRDTEIVIATTTKAGTQIALPVVEALIATIKLNQIDVVIIDPFVSSHAVTENDNMAIDAVCKRGWGAVLKATDCAIELVHHVRKTGGAEITVEDSRGAVALLAAARSARVLNPMTKEEAERAGIEKHRAYFRVDNGKSNLAPPPDKSDWFHLHSVALGNGGGGLYDDGDHVAVATTWEWPNAFDGLHVSDLKRVQEKIASGEWAENSQAVNWAGHAVAQVLNIDSNDKAGKQRIKSLLRTWIANKALKIERQHDARRGREIPLIVVGEPA